MPPRPVRLTDPAAPPADFAALRAELEVPSEFPAEVLAEAEARAAALAAGPARRDVLDLPFVTIDPPGSQDLDQAVFVERGTGGGYRVWYAIADVAAVVAPGGAIDREAWARGTTLYSPDGRAPLHPPVLSEGAASLLPGVDRAALVWTVDLDGDGERTAGRVERGWVRSTAQLSYAQAQEQLDAGVAPEPLVLLREVGRLREERERARGGVSLPVPEQEVEPAEPGGGGGGWRLRYRAPLPVEGWNAQISLLCGMLAADLMLAGGAGVLRTVPEPAADALAALRRTALALGASWPDGLSYPELVRSLDPATPAHAAILRAATGLMRGAGYAAFTDGTAPAQARHAAIADEYAHVTAPLRRLVDRYAAEAALAASAGTELPGWVREALPRLPEAMQAADRRAKALDRAVVDLVEAAVLTPRVGETFDGVVVDADEKRGIVQLGEPAVRGRLDGVDLPLGEAVRVRLVEADPARRTVRFELALA